MSGGETLCCPVCQARFREAQECPRCGADLSPLMHLAAKAYLSRQVSRRALRDGDVVKWHSLARHAESLCSTKTGRQLCQLTSWLNRVDSLSREQPEGSQNLCDSRLAERD